MISSAISANQMQQSFSEGMATGKVNSGAAQNVAKGFNPSEIKGYQANPEQSKYYTGITGDNPNISALGMQELSNSELGKTIRESTVNNPRDNISMDSDIIRNSEEIKRNANIISGMNESKQCVNKVLSKTSFTNHLCEKDNSINKICKTVANVKLSGEKKVIKEDLVFNNIKSFFTSERWHPSYNNQYRVGGWHWKYNIPINVDSDARITHIQFNTTFKCGPNMLSFFGDIYVDVFIGNQPYVKRIEEHSDSGFCSIDVPVNISLNKGSPYIFSFWGGRQYPNDRVIYNDIKFTIEKEVNTLKADLEYANNCSDEEIDNSIKIGEKCTSPGGKRTFMKDGASIEVESDCWETQTEYLVSEASDNECKKYDSNPNCTVGERECLDSVGVYCTRFRLKYQCQHTTRTKGVVCGDKFFCSDGSCADLEGNVNTDFGHAVSQLATLAQAGKDVGLNPDSLKAFSGKAMFCRKTGFGFSNCCKDSGWGHKAGLAQCNSEENALGKAKEKNLVIYTGTYCDKKVLGKCIRKKSSYCVFDNKLARIIQYQGRSGQLGIGFGGAQSPNCRGLSVDELQRIDFNAMDYSDFYEELNSNTKLPDQNQLIDYMKKTITEQLKQE
ncbi:conjugal transfer protein TraN [Glaesserella parasuis]|uniref:conjugal transfer protein TraN n=1 Tax=Glaesserella parasuis TaxID=738 RepID=UPI001319FE2F|nr:conjugal transfer protein TraN [Glaesserella parasuis]MDG6261615.1 conjugal transfer protein TraN [Glaesserella parasuis]MDG6280379.1 conjugal transfer protein TraN [Glaesserella parasuis]MDG6307837.1 conjugal transfer protein TraN [Glaesserella parasuis]MDG6323035.1 conjugal transfer protein TraN [Glaesserella parasuis]MDG6343962.1 conjugal transfer protein TraN [Glaesserella parasuis]